VDGLARPLYVSEREAQYLAEETAILDEVFTGLEKIRTTNSFWIPPAA